MKKLSHDQITDITAITARIAKYYLYATEWVSSQDNDSDAARIYRSGVIDVAGYVASCIIVQEIYPIMCVHDGSFSAYDFIAIMEDKDKDEDEYDVSQIQRKLHGALDIAPPLRYANDDRIPQVGDEVEWVSNGERWTVVEEDLGDSPCAMSNFPDGGWCNVNYIERGAVMSLADPYEP